MTTRPDASVQWQLAGNSAEAYERYLVPQIFTPWAKRLVQTAAIQSSERVLDVGCGTGIVARTTAQTVGAQGYVAGLDRNAAMLEVAEATSNGVSPKIEWRQGSAELLPYADGSFDAVLCQQALQFIEEPIQALAEMRRVLAQEGRVAISVWRAIRYNPVFALFAEVLEHHAGQEAARIMRSPFPEWTANHLRALLEAAGFRDVHLVIGVGSVRFTSTREFMQQESQSSPLALPLGKLTEREMETLHDDLHGTLTPYCDDEGVMTPMETYVILAQA